MRIKVLVEQEVWVDVGEEVYDDDGNSRPMTEKDLYELRDSNLREYDRILDDAFDKAVEQAPDANWCTTLIEVED